MFEAIVMLCAGLAGAPPCRAALVPGYEAASLAGCEAALEAHPAAGAECRTAGEALAVTEVAPGVFVHRGAVAEPDGENRGDTANLGFVIGAAAVAVIDSGSAAWMGEALWRAIRARSDLPVTHLVLTHVHPDHVLGASVFAGAEIVAHAGLPQALARRQETYLQRFEALIGSEGFLGTEVPGIDLEVAERARLDLGGRVLDLRAWPQAHSGTDLTVLDRATGTLFAGDLVVAEHIPPLDGSLRGWQRVLGELEQIPATRVVPGHGGPVSGGSVSGGAVLDWPEGAAPVRRYLGVLAREAAAAVAAGERLSEAVTHIAARERAQWQLFDVFNARNATVAFTELEWE